MDIATAFYEDVPINPNDERYKERMAQVNEILEKLTSAEGGVQPTWRVVKVEPIPQISPREVRWRVGPIVNEIQASFVANRMHEQVFNEVFEPIPGKKGAHFTVWDRGMAAGVVKVEGVPVAAGIGAELNKTLTESNEGRFKGRWTGERPPMRVSQNNKLRICNIKLEVYSWEIAEEMVKKGLRIGEKNHKVEVWGKAPRKARPGTGRLPPSPKPTQTTNKRQTAWTPPRRSNRCFRCGREGHYIAQCPILNRE